MEAQFPKSRLARVLLLLRHSYIVSASLRDAMKIRPHVDSASPAHRPDGEVLGKRSDGCQRLGIAS